MIKAGITGAASREAGELIRILVSHPEVEIVSLVAPDQLGHDAVSVHHGLIGESLPCFTDRFDPSAVDVLFVCSDESFPLVEAYGVVDSPSLRVIDLTGLSRGHAGYVCGVSELFRKPMVRGAMKAYIPSAPAVVGMVSLFPLAANLVLNDSLKMEFWNPAGIETSFSTEEINQTLCSVQQSFSGISGVRFNNSDCQRGIRLDAILETSIELRDIIGFYDRIYDDHNFTYLSARRLDLKEAEGTDKCLITLSKPKPGILRVEAVADARLRGGAGDAVHAMNLLFGLHERTGLVLKASAY